MVLVIVAEKGYNKQRTHVPILILVVTGMLDEVRRNLVQRYIILTLVRQALEKDFNTLQSSSLFCQESLHSFLTERMHEVGREIGALQRDLRKQKLTIKKEKNDGFFTKYSYYFKGYEGTFSLLNARLKHDALTYMKRHLFKLETKQ
jgi:hypothetical protein